MGLKLVIDSLEGLDEGLQSLYTEKDGKFHLQLEDYEDPSGLKKALDSERKARADLEKQVKAWQRMGKTPEEIEELTKRLQKEEEDKARKAGDFEKLLKQHQESWAKEKADLEAELNASRSSERAAIISNSLMAELVKAGITDEGSELLPARLAERVKLEMNGGKRVIRIYQADGETLMAGKGDDGAATFQDLVQEAVKKYPSLFKGTGSGGSGKQPADKGAGGSGSGVRKKSDFKTESERAKFVDEHGMAAYNALPA